MRKPLADAGDRFLTWGYWAGGFFCILGMLALSFGLVPVIKAVKNKPVMMQMPGEESLNLALGGSYIGVGLSSGLSPDALKKMYELQFMLTDQNGNEKGEVVKVPPRNYASDRVESQIPLFQFIIDEPGMYMLRSAYPLYIDGPAVSVILFHTDIGYVRTELFVGIFLFLAFTGLGLYFVVKTYRAQNPKAPRAAPSK